MHAALHSTTHAARHDPFLRSFEDSHKLFEQALAQRAGKILAVSTTTAAWALPTQAPLPIMRNGAFARTVQTTAPKRKITRVPTAAPTRVPSGAPTPAPSASPTPAPSAPPTPACPVGQYSSGGARCRACRPGRWSTGGASDTCNACPAGRFGLGGSGTRGCDGACPAGRWGAGASVSALCDGSCPLGRWGEPGGTSPSCGGPCAAGRYGTGGSISAACDGMCPMGRWSLAGSGGCVGIRTRKQSRKDVVSQNAIATPVSPAAVHGTSSPARLQRSISVEQLSVAFVALVLVAVSLNRLKSVPPPIPVPEAAWYQNRHPSGMAMTSMDYYSNAHGTMPIPANVAAAGTGQTELTHTRQ